MVDDVIGVTLKRGPLGGPRENCDRDRASRACRGEIVHRIADHDDARRRGAEKIGEGEHHARLGLAAVTRIVPCDEIDVTRDTERFDLAPGAPLGIVRRDAETQAHCAKDNHNDK